jgi:hypothetical protein
MRPMAQALSPLSACMATLAATAGLLSCLLHAPSASAQSVSPFTKTPSNEAGWRHAAETDLAFASATLQDNHPGVRERFFRYFPLRLNAARDAAQSLLLRVTDASAYRAVLRRFRHVFHDGHAGIWMRQPRGSESWPVFVAAWRGAALLVLASVPGGPTIGSEVESRDGRPIQSVMRENALSLMGRATDPDERWALAPLVFVDDRDPLVRCPERCRFRAGSPAAELQLTWRPKDSTATAWLRVSTDGEVDTVGLTEPRQGLF